MGTENTTEPGSSDSRNCTQVAAQYLPSVKGYIRNRLRTAVTQERIRPGMYSADDLADEVYLRVCKEFDVLAGDNGKIKIEMFRLANTLLDEIISAEAMSLQGVSISEVLSDELKALEEKYTIDAEGELIPYEDLDDISYQQNTERPEIYLLEPGFEDELINTLDLQEAAIRTDDARRRRLANLYLGLPSMSRMLLDLSTLACLTVEEIAAVCSLETDQVRQTITLVRHHFHAAGLGRS